MMKKYAGKYVLFLVLFAFAITMILWPLATTQPIRSTQEDPGTAKSGFSVSLTKIVDYGDITGILGDLEYDNVNELIQELDINRDDIPLNLQFIYDTYEELCDEIEANLRNLDGIEVESEEDAETEEDAESEEDTESEESIGLLVEAELYLDEGEFDKTYLALNEADHLAGEIEASLYDMDSANELITSILGSFAPKNQTEKAEEFRERLEEDREWLEVLWVAYHESAPENITTKLTNLEVPGKMYAGQTYKISGLITYDIEAPGIERDISLYWDHQKLETSNTYQAESSFEIEFTPDKNTLLGNHVLAVVIEAKDEYSIASENVTLTITRDYPEIKVEDLSFKLLSRKVEIKGRVSFETDLDDAIIVIEIKGKSTSVTPSPEGEFEASIGLPLGLTNLGQQDIKIRIEPSQPWQSPTEITTEIFLLDIVSLGFISTAFLAVGMIVYVTRRGKPGKGGSWILETSPSPELDPEFTGTPPGEFKEVYPEGTRGQVAKTYTETMKRVETATGVSMKINMTLREFLKETAPKLNGAAGAFNELTRLAEDALYSPRVPGPDDLKRAETLALTTREALKS